MAKPGVAMNSLWFHHAFPFCALPVSQPAGQAACGPLNTPRHMRYAYASNFLTFVFIYRSL
jgi:hypothetical protein